MVVLYYAATAPINPSGASPALSAAQVWAGLRHKVRHADQFVPSITSCVVEGEKDNVLTRRIVFEGTKETKETCTELAPHKVEFRLEDGTEIVNIVAAGPSGKEEECYLTYSFKWQFPDIEAGSKEEKDMLAEQQKMAQDAVQSTIKSIREMIKDGRIKA
ncbi:hypothetical protein PWT90_02061 [Aphanocladium album]|nr:hypothetical protein PWT90_02061 [Aphanocladium album]